MKTLYLSAALTLAVIPAAQAEMAYFFADRLVAECQLPSEKCLGYLGGVSDALNSETPGRTVCEPDTVDAFDLAAVLRVFAARNPGLVSGDIRGSVVAGLAFAAAFPCTSI